jgi:hypothetical protein
MCGLNGRRTSSHRKRGRLTIGGLSRVEYSFHTAEMFVAVLDLAARTRRRSRFNPVKVKPVVLTMNQSEGACRKQWMRRG